MNDTDATFGTRLKKALQHRNMTQAQLAEHIGVTRATLSRYVNGEREPRFATAQKIADVLQIHIDQLLGESSDPMEIAIRLVARSNPTKEQWLQLMKYAPKEDE